MKKSVLVLSLLMSSLFSFSQINKGQWLVGGSVGFESSKTGDIDDSKETTFNFSPNAGYFFINNLAGGLRVNFQTFKEA
jgi:hypothetical protein